MSRIAMHCLSLLLALAATAAAAETFVLTGPPRESRDKSEAAYEPIAAFLTKATGARFEYRHPDNYLSYQSEMRKDAYDLVFDGPHFIGWRMARLGHVPLVKIPGQLVFVVIARKSDARINELKDLIGQTVCGFAPPNISTLTALFQFDNPMRQPALIETQGFRTAYDAVVSGKCTGGVLQGKLVEEFDKDANAVKVVFRSKPLPNQGISASKRIGPELRARVTEALLSPAGKAATQTLRADFKGQDFVPAGAPEYEGLGVLLRDVWGFDLEAPATTGR